MNVSSASWEMRIWSGCEVMREKNYPIRNRTSRVKGQGVTRRIKQITGISNSGTGGVGRLSPFMADSTTEVFAGLTLQRPKRDQLGVFDAAGDHVRRSR